MYRRLRIRGRTVRGYFLLPHLVPVLIVELATAGFALIAWGGWPPAGTLARLLLAMLGGQLAIGALNEIIDFADDAVGKPWKPLPSGAVSVRGAQAMLLGGLLLMTAAGLSFGPLSFGLLMLGTGLGFAYDLWLKRSPWSWLPYLLALPLLPLWVFISLGRPESRLLLLYPLGALATIGAHFAQALPDITIDRAAGMRTLTSRLGTHRTFALAWLAALSGPCLALIVSRVPDDATSSHALLAAAGLSLVLAAINFAVFVVDRRIGVALCFPLVAVVVLMSGLAWTLSVAAARG